MPRKIAVGSSKSKKMTFKEEIETGEKKEDKYKLRIPAKSKSVSFPDALKIIPNYHHWEEGRVQFVTFPQPNPDLKKLMSIARKWTVSQLSINDEVFETDDFYWLKPILFCQDKERCNGICKHKSFNIEGRNYGYSIQEIVEIITPKKDELTGLIDDWNWEKGKLIRFMLSEGVMRKIDEKTISINHEAILEKISRDLTKESKFCDIFNWKAIEKELSGLLADIIIPDQYLRRTGIFRRNETESEESEVREGIRPIIKFKKSIDYFQLPEDNIEQIAQKISQEMEKVLRKLFTEAGLLKK